jgi:hypothetical protein
MNCPNLDRLRAVAYEWLGLVDTEATIDGMPEYFRRRSRLEETLRDYPDAWYRLPRWLVTLEGGWLRVYSIQDGGLPTHPAKPIVDLRTPGCAP